MTSISAILCCLVALIYSVAQVQCLYGSEDAKPGQYPYYVGLYFNINYEESPFAFCGGAILNNQWILTAAECAVITNNIDEVIVKAGSIYNRNQTKDEQLSFVEKSFRPDNKIDSNGKEIIIDIALFKLKTPLVFNEHVGPIDLPEALAVPNGEGTIVGLGMIGSYPNFKSPSILQTLKLPIIEYNECVDIVTKLLGPDFISIVLDDTKFCTAPTKENQGHCLADRGDPLVTKVQGKNVVVGVANEAFEMDCSTPGAPSVYTKVSIFNDWIKDTIKAN